MQWFKTVAELPEDVRENAEKHLASVEIALEAAEKLGGCTFRDRDNPVTTFRAEPRGAYKDDGNTSTPGTAYDLLWVRDFKHPGHDSANGSWSSWYHGSLCFAIASHMSMHVRDSDRALSYGGVGSELTVGRWPDVKQERIGHSHGADLYLPEDLIVKLVEQTRLVLAHLDLRVEVKKLMDKKKPSRAGR